MQDKNVLKTMLDMQHTLQIHLAKETTGNSDPCELKTLGQIYEWLRDNKIALDDEFREVVDALPGINLPEKSRSGLWKKWKANHTELCNKTFDELTDDEKHNLQEEFVDLFHFVLNMMLALRIDSETLFKIYYEKNHINAERYSNKY